jgi:hypothetical protein
MSRFSDRAGDIALQTRQADVRQARSRNWSPDVPRSTSASTATSPGSAIFMLRATRPIAPMKQADQPAANNCSGVGAGAGAARRRQLDVKPAILAAAGAIRPPNVWLLPV